MILQARGKREPMERCIMMEIGALCVMYTCVKISKLFLPWKCCDEEGVVVKNGF